MTDPWDAVADCPPSCKLVVKTLEHEGELTQSELRESTRLPGRTLRSALTRLRDVDVIAQRETTNDRRGAAYRLKTDGGRDGGF